MILYRSNLKNRFLAESALPQNFDPHLRLASRQCRLDPDQNSKEPPCQNSDSSSCFVIAALSIVFSLFFLAMQSEPQLLFALGFCSAVVIGGIWKRARGVMSVLVLALLCDWFLGGSPFPWMLLLAQTSFAVCFILAKTLLIPPIETRVELSCEPKIDTARLHLLNNTRVTLWEKELLLEHSARKNEKWRAMLEEKQKEILALQQQIDHHPALIAHRELRKQFKEKSEAMHAVRKQLFTHEGELLIRQMEQEENDLEITEKMVEYIAALADAQQEIEKREEHIRHLEQHIQYPAPKRTLAKRTVRRKKSTVQAELFDTMASAT